MHRFPILALAFATITAVAGAQTIDSTAPTNAQPAPITRSPGGYAGARINTLNPAGGVLIRSDANASVKTVSSDKDSTEIRVEKGRATVQINHPAGETMISVDLPGGQVDLLKNGLYTFNADTNTLRVLRGEADAFPGSAASGKGIKVKEDHELSFAASGKVKSVEVDPRTLTADLVPGPGGERGYAGGGGAYGSGYRPGPYGDGFAEYPYPYYPYAWGYPYGFYPYYGFGYPFGFGLGFGFYGGFRGGFGGFRR